MNCIVRKNMRIKVTGKLPKLSIRNEHIIIAINYPIPKNNIPVSKFLPLSNCPE